MTFKPDKDLEIAINNLSISILWFTFNSTISNFSLKIEPFYPGIFSSIFLFASFITFNRGRDAK